MDETHRYKIKLTDRQAFDSALDLLERNATVLLANPGRNTIAATAIDDETADRLKDMNASITEDQQYSPDR